MIKVRCPICDQEMPGPSSDWPEYPFCGRRCRTIDLGRWLGESYRIPAATAGEGDEVHPESSEKDDQAH